MFYKDTGSKSLTTGSCFPEDIWNFSVISNFNLKALRLQILIPQLLFVFRRHHKYQIVSGGNQRLFSANRSCAQVIFHRAKWIWLSLPETWRNTWLCFSQGLNYIILLGNLKANVIWRQRNKKKMLLAVLWATHGMERDTGESSWVMETLCLWIAPPGDIATVTHITTLALRASLGYWRCPAPFWLISFSLQSPLPQNAFLLSQSDVQSVHPDMEHIPGQNRARN